MRSVPIRFTCTAAITILLAIPSTVPVAKPAASSPSNVARYTPYRVGEVLEYKVSWSRFLTAATMRTEVRKRGILDDIDSYHVVMQAETSGLANILYKASSKYESYVDAHTLLPHRALNSLKQPKREKKRRYRLEPDNSRAFLQDGRTIPIPPSTYDVAALFYTIRGMDLAPNKPARFTLIENDKLQTLVAEVEGFEDIKTEAGRFKTARISVKFENDGVVSDSKKLRVYLSNDSKRQPVLITVDLPLGSIRIELVSAR
ncbi:MAG: DUF3108 domain-containing protein [Acidobacteria bacterium]|nr:DUF3108 domain-containing protein [Acidobacteriota bacterium]